MFEHSKQLFYRFKHLIMCKLLQNVNNRANCLTFT